MSSRNPTNKERRARRKTLEDLFAEETKALHEEIERLKEQVSLRQDVIDSYQRWHTAYSMHYDTYPQFYQLPEDATIEGSTFRETI